MNSRFVALRFFLIMTFLTGVIYPLIVTLYGQLVVPEKANGSWVLQGEINRGSVLIAQKFSSSRYFWPRPSAIDYNPLSSAGTNLGPTSDELKKIVNIRAENLRLAHDKSGDIPQDLLFASGSGLDPHISKGGAFFQCARVATARGLEINRVRQLVIDLTEGPQFGIFGESRVNVLKLNLALDEMK